MRLTWDAIRGSIPGASPAVSETGQAPKALTAPVKGQVELSGQTQQPGFLQLLKFANSGLGDLMTMLNTLDQIAGVIVPVLTRSTEAQIDISAKVSTVTMEDLTPGQAATIRGQDQGQVVTDRRSGHGTDAPRGAGGPVQLPMSITDQLEVLQGLTGDIKLSELREIILGQMDPAVLLQLQSQ